MYNFYYIRSGLSWFFFYTFPVVVIAVILKPKRISRVRINNRTFENHSHNSKHNIGNRGLWGGLGFSQNVKPEQFDTAFKYYEHLLVLFV